MRRLVGAALVLVCLAVTARADIRFRALETPDLRIVYYDSEHEYILQHLTRSYENSMRFYKSFFDYEPSERVTVFFQDFDDYGYAGTSTIPNNYLTLGIEPFEYVYETCPTNERFNWVMMHELMHVVASENATGADHFFRGALFGKVNASPENPESILYTYLTNPRRYAPRWYHEGIAVFMETWLAGGIGRALGGYDEMVFRSMVRDGAYFYDVVGLESEGTAADFQVGQNSYLYGTRFMSYLANRHGPEKVIEWVNRAPGSKAYYASQFKHVFGESLDDQWHHWIEWEQQWQQTNLDSIRQYPVTVERVACERALGSASRGFYEPATGKLYTAVNYPGEFSHIASIDIATGKMRKICEVQTPALYYVTSLAYDPDGRKLYFTTNNSKHWRDLNVVDIATGVQKRLLANNRTGDLAFNRADGSLWGVQHHNGFSTLVRIEAPYNDWSLVREVMQMPYGKDMFDLDISPDGRHVTFSMLEVTGRVVLVRMNTEGDARRRRVLRSAMGVPENRAAQFRVFARRELPLRHVLSDRRGQRVPLQLREAGHGVREQLRDGLLPAHAHTRRFTRRVQLHRTRFASGGHPGRGSRGRGRDPLPGKRSGLAPPGSGELEARLAARYRLRVRRNLSRELQSHRQYQSDVALPGHRSIQGQRLGRIPGQLHGSGGTQRR